MLDPTEYTPECVRNALEAAEVGGSRNLAVLAAEVSRQRADIDQMAAVVERMERREATLEAVVKAAQEVRISDAAQWLDEPLAALELVPRPPRGLIRRPIR